MHSCKERHLFLYRTQDDAAQASKSFPLTVGVHKDAGVPATRTTPEVTSMAIVTERAKSLCEQHRCVIEVLPCGTPFTVLREGVLREGGDGNVCSLTEIQVGTVNAWVICGTTWEKFQEVSADVVQARAEEESRTHWQLT